MAFEVLVMIILVIITVFQTMLDLEDSNVHCICGIFIVFPKLLDLARNFAQYQLCKKQPDINFFHKF